MARAASEHPHSIDIDIVPVSCGSTVRKRGEAEEQLERLADPSRRNPLPASTRASRQSQMCITRMCHIRRRRVGSHLRAPHTHEVRRPPPPHCTSICEAAAAALRAATVDIPSSQRGTSLPVCCRSSTSFSRLSCGCSSGQEQRERERERERESRVLGEHTHTHTPLRDNYVSIAH